MAGFNLKRSIVKMGILPVIEALVSESDLPIYITNETMTSCIFQIGTGIDYHQQLAYQTASHQGSHDHCQSKTDPIITSKLDPDLSHCSCQEINENSATTFTPLKQVTDLKVNLINSDDHNTNSEIMSQITAQKTLAASALTDGEINSNSLEKMPSDLVEHSYDHRNIYLQDWQQHSIINDTEVVGYVLGNSKSAAVAQFINYSLQREAERKSLANEVLEKYREINFLYKIGDKLSNCLTVEQISNLLLDEMTKIIDTTSASVMLINEQTGILEIVSSRGTAAYTDLRLKPGEGIAGYVFASGKAEIVNYLDHDPRYTSGQIVNQCLICVIHIRENHWRN